MAIERWKERFAGGRWALSIAIVCACTLSMLAVRQHLDVLNVLLIYLLAVFMLALFTDATQAAAMAVVSFLLFDFLFIPPYYTFSIAAADHVLTVFVYLGVAIVTARLVASVRAGADVAIREQQRTALLYDLNSALIRDVTSEEILNTIVRRVVDVYGAAACRILLPGGSDGRLEIRASYPAASGEPLDRQMLAIAEWALEHRAPAGLGARGRQIRVPHGMKPEALARPDERKYIPIATATRAIGVLEVTGAPVGHRLRDDDDRVLTSFADQAALALERGRLAELAAEASALSQSNELKSALLAAVSHDLRTPLAVIKTSTTSLLDAQIAWGDAERAEFLTAIDEETDRLSLMVSNLLDLSRIEGGVLTPDREWYDAPELIEDVKDRLQTRGLATHHAFRTEIEPDLPMIYLDYVEIAQVLMNLGENAINYAGPNQESVLGVRAAGDALEFSVHDNGPGIPRDEVERVFEKHYRLKRNSRAPGSGIGLSICKGIVEAHGGRIWVESKPDQGATFRFTIPVSATVKAAA
jgi:two-component system sensor histidine kinase KdpD